MIVIRAEQLNYGISEVIWYIFDNETADLSGNMNDLMYRDV